MVVMQPLFTSSWNQSKSGFFGDNKKWNFTKFLVDNDGNVVDRYAPTTSLLKIEVLENHILLFCQFVLWKLHLQYFQTGFSCLMTHLIGIMANICNLMFAGRFQETVGCCLMHWETML